MDLTDSLYQELKGCANRLLAGQNGCITLQSTEIVHEACLKVYESNQAFNNKAHVYRCAAKAMRHLLIDHARAKSSKKRTPAFMTQSLTTLLNNNDENLGLFTIDKTLEEMNELGERTVNIAELHYFASFSQKEIAKHVEIGLATVERELKFARAFITDKLLQSHA